MTTKFLEGSRSEMMAGCNHISDTGLDQCCKNTVRYRCFTVMELDSSCCMMVKNFLWYCHIIDNADDSGGAADGLKIGDEDGSIGQELL